MTLGSDGTDGTGGPSYDPVDADVRRLLLQWYRRVRKAQLAHGDAATVYAARSRRLGVPAVVLSALVGTSVFATIGDEPDLWLKVLTGLVSMTAAVLTALQTFLRSDNTASEHQQASRGFGAIRRQIGRLGAVAGTDRATLVAAVDSIRDRYDEVSAGSPNIPPRVWQRREAGADAFFPEEFGLWPSDERQAQSSSS